MQKPNGTNFPPDKGTNPSVPERRGGGMGDGHGMPGTNFAGEKPSVNMPRKTTPDADGGAGRSTNVPPVPSGTNFPK